VKIWTEFMWLKIGYKDVLLRNTVKNRPTLVPLNVDIYLSVRI